jgi:hypothetical protein
LDMQMPFHTHTYKLRIKHFIGLNLSDFKHGDDAKLQGYML